MMSKRIAKCALFLLLVAAVVAGSSVLLRPMFSTSYGRNIETIRGLYHQPENSVQAVFLGTSSMLSAVAPVQIYQQTGLQTYNCATRSQPLIVSYYLLKEVYRLNPKSLTTVIIDPVKLIDEEGSSAKAKESVLLMQPSMLKLEALLECSRYYEDFDFLENVIPAFGYHTRWSALGPNDYDYLAKGDNSLNFADHGYLASYGAMYEEASQASSWEGRAVLTDERELSGSSYESAYRNDKRYLDSIVGFCGEEGIDLLFVKLPRINWDDYSHDSISYLAEQYGVDFIDMNSPEVASKLGLLYQVDYMDTKHANVQGSVKVTSFICEVLESRLQARSANQGLNAVSDSFADSDLEARQREVDDSALFGCLSLPEYLKLLSNPSYTVFIATSGGKANIDADLAASLRELGLDTLAELRDGKYYCGIMSQGRGIRGMASEDAEAAFYRASFDGKRLVLGERSMQPGASLDTPVSIQAGDLASITVLGYDRCVKDRGLCMVVFDSQTGDLIDSSCFKLEAPYSRIARAIPAEPEV